MEKSEFASFLSKNGYPCSFVNGIPTVHANTGDKTVLKKIRELKKMAGYDQSFSIKYDGVAALLDEDMGDDATEISDISTGDVKAADVAPNVEEKDDISDHESNSADLLAESGFFDFDLF